MDEQKDDPAEQSAEGCRRSLRRLRLRSGMAVLYVSMGSMVALVVLDVVFSMTGAAERALISNAFEAFKLIAVTVLGYIFGANQTGERSGGDDQDGT